MHEKEGIERLSRDLANASTDMTNRQARYMVHAYYVIQDQRMRADSQVRTMPDEPHLTLTWFNEQSRTLEAQVKRALDAYSLCSTVGRWSRSVCGIGPVIAAALMAHINIERCPTAGHIWAFAGLDPTKEWKKGEKRPWNAALRTLCWKIGESFVKVSSRPDAYYGHVYLNRKQYEKDRNERGDYAQIAADIISKRRFERDTTARKHYEIGRLPDAHIHARAKRYAVKLFLAHWHEVAYRDHFKKEPPAPYAVAILGHEHYLSPNIAEENNAPFVEP